MSQKNPIVQSIKVQRLSKDMAKGVLSIHSTQNSIVMEKAIISAYTDLKRSTKGLGIVWLKPLQIKTTTTKGGKRMGKGKGIQTTYNRAVPIKAGQLIFEIGYVTQLSGRSTSLSNLLRPCFNKLSFNVSWSKRNNQPFFFTPDATLTLTNYK